MSYMTGTTKECDAAWAFQSQQYLQTLCGDTLISGQDTSTEIRANTTWTLHLNNKCYLKRQNI